MDLEPNELVYFVKYDAECIDVNVGQLLGKYLCDAVDPKEKEIFERHLEECIACWTDVANWNNLGYAKGD
ncbi:MAG TPA: hypothetical protein VGR73_07955 [Bryobacteraceae bacterium]|nr:hypothetical protein [Bryobacteraceae bacterium]